MKSERADIPRRYLEALNNKDTATIREIFAEDAVVEDPVGTDPYVGIEAIVKFFESGFAADVKTELTEKPRVAGNYVAFVFKVIIPGMIIEPIDVFEFNDDGKVALMKAFWSEDNCTAD